MKDLPMSEYQYIHFVACDRPLDDKQLAYMEEQSTRADISRWEFTNEYHFGDFHGNATEMLRRGYDMHLHFANYGIRRLMFRLPELPCDKKTLLSAMLSLATQHRSDPISSTIFANPHRSNVGRQPSHLEHWETFELSPKRYRKNVRNANESKPPKPERDTWNQSLPIRKKQYNKSKCWLPKSEVPATNKQQNNSKSWPKPSAPSRAQPKQNRSQKNFARTNRTREHWFPHCEKQCSCNDVSTSCCLTFFPNLVVENHQLRHFPVWCLKKGWPDGEADAACPFPDSWFLIPDSWFLIPDSWLLTPDSWPQSSCSNARWIWYSNREATRWCRPNGLWLMLWLMEISPPRVFR